MRNRHGDIISFDGDERYLSNFYQLPEPVFLDGMEFYTVEAAYQAAKTFNPEFRRAMSRMTPGKSKTAGRALIIRHDWEEVKYTIMKDLVTQKFNTEPFRTNLMETHKHIIIIEGNHWGDIYWGMSGGIGENHLGKIIMEIRDKLMGVHDHSFPPEMVMRGR